MSSNMTKDTLELRRPHRHPNAALSTRGWVDTETNELLFSFKGGVPQVLVDEVNGATPVFDDNIVPMAAMSAMMESELEPDMNHLEMPDPEPELEPEVIPKPTSTRLKRRLV